jgi:hypothetical protein
LIASSCACFASRAASSFCLAAISAAYLAAAFSSGEAVDELALAWTRLALSF